jgi:hypothetical protein
MSDHNHPHDHAPGHDHAAGHGHAHGIVDPSITSSEHGLWALKWSFFGLAATALLQLFVVIISAASRFSPDTIHNFGDAHHNPWRWHFGLPAETEPPLYLWLWTGRGSGRHIDCRYDS